MRTIIYVDGFNLYFRMLKPNPQFKWLNPHQLAREILIATNQITKVRYFTARVSGRLDPQAPGRQQIYLDALANVPEIQMHFGKFLATKAWAGLVHPNLDPTKPRAKPPFLPWPQVVRIFRTDEKGSDVNLATYLLIDSFRNNFDVAAVVTNDTDLVEPIRFVTQDMGKVVGLLTPVPQPAHALAKAASFVHHIREKHLRAAQFPEPLTLASGRTIHKPASWA